MITERLKPLYNVKLIETGKQHFYQIDKDETWLPGVTTVLGAAIPKPALLPWALNSMEENLKPYIGQPLTKEMLIDSKNIYKKKAQDAADIGTRVHKAIDDIIKGTTPTEAYGADIEPAIQGFKDWRDSTGITIEIGDSKIGSKLFGFGGSLDLMGFDKNGDAVILDVKTTKRRKDRNHGAYPEAGLQLSAYQCAFRETYGIDAKSLYVLWINKEQPEFKAVKVANPSASFEGFLSALKLYNLSKFETFDENFI